jgi:integrase
VLSLQQVFTLADVIHPRYRALILLAVFGCLRWGELAALRRMDIDLATRTVRIERTLTELRGNGQVFGPPKTDAGHRTVAFPDFIVSDLTSHLAQFTAPEADALVSQARPAPRCGPATSVVVPGRRPSKLPGSRPSTFTICGTQATHSPPRQVPTSGNSWNEWATAAPVPP